MKRNNTQFERQVDIDRRIRAGEYPSCATLAADWEVAERTIKRDIEFMRDRLGAPVDYDRSRKGYCYTETNWNMPAVSVNEGELLALLLARHALEQYQDLPLGNLLSRFYEQVLETAGMQAGAAPDQMLRGYSFIAPPSLSVDPEIWDALSRALLNRCSIEMDYQSLSAEKPAVYRLDPLHIANIEGDWYLFARSHHKGDVLQFAIGRIAAVRGTGKAFALSDDFAPESLKQKLFGRYVALQGKTETVRIRVSLEAGAHLRQWHEKQKTVRRKDGSIEISFPIGSGDSKQPYGNVISWVLGMGRHARVLAPARLKELVEQEIRRMASPEVVEGGNG